MQQSLATKPRECTCGCACSIGPLAWPDIVAIQDDYGIQPTAEPDLASTASAGILHAVYWRWADRQTSRADALPVMPLSLVLGYLRDDYDRQGTASRNRTVRAVVLTALNDPDNRLRLRRCPGSLLRRN